MFRGPQFIRKKLLQAESFQNKLNLVMIYNFETLSGRTNAFGGPRVWDPVYSVSQELTNDSYIITKCNPTNSKQGENIPKVYFMFEHKL